MKYLPVVLLLLRVGILVAGCMFVQGGIITAAPTQTPQTTAITPAPQPSFALGGHYLTRSLTFQSESQVDSESVRVDNPSWGIEFTVLALNENLQYCWFEMIVTNMDTGHSEIYGYGRDNGYELHRLIPMYSTGLYSIVMKGNRVKVDVDITKREP